MMKTHDEFVAAAHDLAPLITAVARSAELARQPDDGVIAAARDSGLFTMMSPRCYGGAELDLDTFFEVGLILGAADASHGWILDFYIEHVWMFTQFPRSFQEELFAGRSYVLAPAALSPAGTARAVDGGYQLSGRWQWGTGIVHAEWVIVGSIVPRDDGAIDLLFFAMPRHEVAMDDTWHMDGMCATGSHDIVIGDLFVPVERTVSISQMLAATAPGSAMHAGPLYSTPMAPILSFAAALPVLGTARACVAEYARQVQTRYSLATLQLHSERTSRQARLAEAELHTSAAEALCRSVLAEIMQQRANASERTRVRWTAAIAHAVEMCQRSVNLLCEAAGSSSHFLDNPLQRARRDVNTMACHMVFDNDERRRCLGRALLDMPSESIWH